MNAARVHVYLLAAGRGRRSRGPKAWREHAGRPLLAHHVTFLEAAFAGARVVVSIQPSWLPRCEALSTSVLWVGVDPDGTPFGALRALLEACPLTRWSFVYHVDMPLWDASIFQALLARVPVAESNGADAVVPVHEGSAGHPVLLAPRAAPSLLALDVTTDRLDHWLRGSTVERVEVEAPSVLENWNVRP